MTGARAVPDRSAGAPAMRVLLATDGSPAAAVAVDLVAGLAWPAGTVVQVIQAVPTGTALFGGPWPAVALVQAERIETDLRAVAQRDVDDVRARLARPGLETVGEVVEGRPASVIVQAADAMGADLLVVGSRGHGTIETMLLGSVSAEVADHAPMPVLVARGSHLGRVVLAWDGSSCAARAAEAVRRWPILAGSAIHVVSVADAGFPWWSASTDPGTTGAVSRYRAAAEASRQQHVALARELTAELVAAGLHAEADGRDGDAASEILAAARETDADLIVLGTHGRTGLARLVMGSVARNVLQHAPCSVLVVRPGSRAI